MKPILQFLFATYLFSKGFRKASVIAAALHIHPAIVCTWAETPFWTIGTRFWGYTGKDKVTGIQKWQAKQMQKERIEKEKNALRRQNGTLENDLNTAESLWRKLILKGDL